MMSSTSRSKKQQFHEPRTPAEKSPAQEITEHTSEEPDLVDEAIAESFPASDPPTFTGTTVTPSRKSVTAPRPQTADDSDTR